MNYYSLFPLAAFFINISLAIFALWANKMSRLNRVFSLFTFSFALWSISSFMIYTSPTLESAFVWEKVETFGSLLSASFMLHFCLVFSRNRLIRSKTFIVLMYIPAFLFTYLNAATRLIAQSQVPSYWGYRVIPGDMYYLFTIFIVLYALASITSCSIFYRQSKLKRERKQSLLLIAGICIIVSGGVASEVIAPFVGTEIMPLTSTLSAVNGMFIAFAMVRYRLMSLTPSIAAENIIKTMVDYLLVVNNDKSIAFVSDSLFKAIGYGNIHKLNENRDNIFPEGKFEGILKRIASDKNITDLNTTILTKNGKEIPVSLNGSIVPGKGSEIGGYVVVMRDMTRVFELIANLKEKTTDLEKSKSELQESKEKLEDKIEETERINKLAVGRELKMVELKKKLAELKGKKS